MRENANLRANRDDQPTRQTETRNPQAHRNEQPAMQTEEEEAFVGVNRYQPYNTRNQNNIRHEQEASRNERNEIIQPRMVIETTNTTPMDKDSPQTMVEELPTTTDEPEEMAIEDKINNIEVSNEVKDTQKEEIKNLLLERKDLFAQTIEELGQTDQ
ncbi:8843_t:CDS:2, partial [Acaulospora morrowiae]